MKHHLISFFILLLIPPCISQNVSIEEVLNKDILYVPKIDKQPIIHTLYLETGYAKSKIINLNDIKTLKSSLIEKIELIYSDFKRSNNFNQNSLNKERIVQLKSVLPEAFTNPLTTWQFVCQTKCPSIKVSKSLFHGFRITYRDKSVTTKSEIEDIISSLVPIPSPETPYWGEKVELDFGTLDTIVSSHSSKIHYSNYPIRDSTVLKVLNRNKWQNAHIICDVTGSMTPYTTQLLLWFKLNNIDSIDVKSVTFFNDGDRKLQRYKIIGETGGIYHVEHPNKFNSIKKTAFETMKKGDGGDIKENNIEATLEVTKLFPDATELIMIADNFATPRDFSLYDQLNKPIKIVLCGATNEINLDYLNFAKETGSTIHLIEDDLTNLIGLHEGETFKVNKIKYKVFKGNIIKTSR